MLALMSSRRFAPLFWTQFLSAFNDNFLKNAIVFFVLFKLAAGDSEALVTLAGAIFIAPSFIFSGLGGELADRFDKAKVARTLKAAEIAAAGAAATGFWLGSWPVLFGALFLFGTVSALFGPIKYGILPDHLSFEEIRPATRSSKAPPSSRFCSAPSRAASQRKKATPRCSAA